MQKHLPKRHVSFKVRTTTAFSILRINHLQVEGVVFIDYLSRLKRDRAVKKVQKLVKQRGAPTEAAE